MSNLNQIRQKIKTNYDHMDRPEYPVATVDLGALGKDGTEALLSQLYMKARSRDLPREARRELEASLSETLVQMEYGILAAKQESRSTLEDLFRDYRAVLKKIGDGLAWRFFSFSEISIKVFAEGKGPGFMAGKLGYSVERDFINASYDTPEVAFAIQNDITNCLRLGDITVLSTENDIFPFEIKTSKRMRPRVKRQAARMLNVAEGPGVRLA